MIFYASTINKSIQFSIQPILKTIMSIGSHILKLLSNRSSKNSVASLFQKNVVSPFILATSKLIRIFISAVNRRKLYSLFTVLMLSALLSACGDGGADISGDGGGGGDTTPPPLNTVPLLLITSNLLTLPEDFSSRQRIATAAFASKMLAEESTTGVITVTTSVTGVFLSSIPNANGRMTLIITASSGTVNTSTEMVVVVTAVNDTPTLTIPTTNLTVTEDFSGINTLATATDIDSNTLTISVIESTTGVVSVTTSTTGAQVANMPNANGVTTLTITVSDGFLSSMAQVVVTVTAANDTPMLSIPTASVTVSEDFSDASTIASATDIDGNTLTFSVTESTTGVVSVTTSVTGVSISSIASAIGRTTLSITVSDGSLSSTAQVVVTVTAINKAPTLTVSTSVLTRFENFQTVVPIFVTSTDTDGDALNISITESTTGVVRIVAIPGTFLISSFVNVNGRTTLTITVSDGFLSSTAQVVVTVLAPNTAPTLTIPTAVLTVLEGFTGARTVASATDVDGNTLTLSVTESTTGVIRVTTSATGVSVSSIPNVRGRTTLTITVNDGSLSSTAQVVVAVSAIVNTPTLTVSTTALTLSEDFSTVVPIFISSADADGNPLNISVVESTTGVVSLASYPTAILISNIANANGQTTLTITASNSLLSLTSQVVVQVTAVNDTPTLTIPSAILSVPENFSGTRTIVTATDIDGNMLTIGATESTTGVIRVTTSATGVSVSNLPNVNGRTTLAITVNDGSLSITTQVVVAVTAIVNTPTLTVSTTALTLSEDFSTVVPIFISSADADGNPLNISVVESTTGVVSLVSHPTAILVSSIANVNGQTTLTITASNSLLSLTSQVVVQVTAVNDTPTLTIPSAILSVPENFSGTRTIVTATDIDGNMLTIGATESTTGVIRVTTSATGVSVSSLPNVNGRTTLAITVNDGSLSITTQVVVVVVTANSVTPTLTVSTMALTLSEDFSTVVPIFISSADADGNPLNISVVESTTGVVSLVSHPTAILVSSIANVNGQTTLTITASNSLLSLTSQVVVQVTAVNDTPTLTIPSAILSVPENFSGTRTIVTATDIDGNMLTFGATESTTGVIRVTTSATGVSVSSLPNVNGRTTLAITVNDGSLSITTQVVVTVTAIINTPTLTVSTTALTLSEDFSTVVPIFISSADADGNPLNISIVESTTGVVSLVSHPTAILVSSIANVNGQTTLTITASNSLLRLTSQVVVQVTAVNDTPTLTIPSAIISVPEDFSGTRTIVTASDLDSNSLTFSVIETTTGMVSVTTSTSGVQIASISNANGVTNLTVAVSDGFLSSTAQILVQVTAVNDTPTLTITTASLTVMEDFVGAMTIATASDIEGSILTFSVAESNTGVVSITTSVTAVSISKISHANGSTTLTISVDDGFLSSTAQVVVTVSAVNDTPTLTVSTNAITANAGFSTITINTTASDIENGALSFTVVESSAGVVIVTTSTNTILLNTISSISGITTLTVRTADLAGVTVTQTIVVNVLNSPPVLNVSSNRISVQEDFSNSAFITVTATDANNDAIRLSISSSIRLVDAVFSTLTGGVSTLSLTSLNNANGTATLTVHATDAGGQATTAGIVVVVEPVNDSPTLSVLTNPLILDEDFQTTRTVVTATDIDRDALNFSVIDSSAGVVTVTTSALGVQISSIGNANGATTLTITVSDGRLSSTTDMAVQIRAINDPPVVTVSTTALTLNEDFASTVLIGTTRTDVDNDSLTLSVTESATGVVSVTTTAAGIQVARIGHANGQTTLTISVNDGSTITLTQVVVKVIAVNDTTTISILSNPLILNEDFVGFSTIATAVNVDGDVLKISVAESMSGVVNIITSAPDIGVTSIDNAIGQTIIFITVDDGSVSFTTQVVVIVNAVNDTPTLSVSTTVVTLNEDFATPLAIFTSATDIEGDSIRLSFSSSTHLVNAVFSTPTNNMSTITLTSILNAYGIATLTVHATEIGGKSTSTEIVVRVNAVNNDFLSFNLSTSVISLSVPGKLLDRYVQSINISNLDIQPFRVRWQVSQSGAQIFSSNPAPVVSFTTNALTTETTLSSESQTSHLYFSIAPNQDGTATLTIQLDDLTRSRVTQQTLIVKVDRLRLPPVIAQASTRIQNLMVHSARLYANSMATFQGVNAFLADAEALGGHLVNINTIEEFAFLQSPASGLITQDIWLGMVLPQLTFPGELFWRTNDSTIAYGFSRGDNTADFTAYPGHYLLNWESSGGLVSNKPESRPSVFNWATYLRSLDFYVLLGDRGDGALPRSAVYEFPQGLAPASINSIPVFSGSSATVRLTGFDYFLPTIDTSNWIVMATTGTVSLDNVYQGPGVQTVELVYTAPANFNSQSTVVVTLQNSGFMTTMALSFTPILPTFTLASTSVVLTENSTQTIRNQQLISNVMIPAYIETSNTLDTQWRVTQSGDAIFSNNPAPVVSFSTNAIVTAANVGSTAQTAQLYFSIKPDNTGTATLTLQLSSPTHPANMFQQTLVVQVNKMIDVPYRIGVSSGLQNLIIQGGHLYANSVITTTSINPYLAEAQNLGGHLININTIEEFNFVRSTDSGLISQNAWFGLILPQLTFPGELIWMTNDSTIAYGYASDNGATNFNIYPGHYALTWNDLFANRGSTRPSVFNAALYSKVANGLALLGDRGDQTPRVGLYEFPTGLAPLKPIDLLSNSSTTVRLTAFDLNGDTISTSNWSVLASTGTVILNSVSQSTGLQTMDLIYTAPANHRGQTTVVVTFQVDGLVISTDVLFEVDGPPTLVVSTYSITLDEDFPSFIVRTTATDAESSTTIITARSSRYWIIPTVSTQGIILRPVAHLFGRSTLTVQATDASGQFVSTKITVIMNAVNDAPTLIVSTYRTSLGQIPVVLSVLASDVEDGILPLSVSSGQGVVNATISTPNLILSRVGISTGSQFVLTLQVTDSSGVKVSTSVTVILSPLFTVSTGGIKTLDFVWDAVSTATHYRLENNTDGRSGFMDISSRNIVFSPNSTNVQQTTAQGLVALHLYIPKVNNPQYGVKTCHGTACAFLHNTVALTNSQLNSMIGRLEASNGQVNHYFSSDLSLSADGNTLVAGAPGSLGADIDKSPYFGFRNTGSAYVFRRTGGVWIRQGYLRASNGDADDRFGTSVSLSADGNTIAVGAVSEASSSTGINGVQNNNNEPFSGAVYIFRNNGVVWTQQAYIKASNTGRDSFGRSVSISNDGNTLAVGATREDSSSTGVNGAQNDNSAIASGAVYVFRNNGGVWTQQAYIKASNAEAEDGFGNFVGLSADGNTLAVGATREDSSSTGVNGAQNDNKNAASGAVYVFRFSSNTWSQQAYIKASNSEMSDSFGGSVSLSADGNSLAVGAALEDSGSNQINIGQADNNAKGSGAVYVFRFSGGVWSQQAYIKSSNSEAEDSFGQSVSLSQNGNILAVSAPDEDGSAAGVGALSDNRFSNAGAVYVFEFSNGAWAQQAYVKSSSPFSERRFGTSVRLSDDGRTLAVGAPGELSNRGAVYLY